MDLRFRAKLRGSRTGDERIGGAASRSGSTWIVTAEQEPARAVDARLFREPVHRLNVFLSIPAPRRDDIPALA
jgi:hypothetical protein